MAAEEDQRQEFESHCEEIKNKNMEDLNVLRMILETEVFSIALLTCG